MLLSETDKVLIDEILIRNIIIKENKETLKITNVSENVNGSYKRQVNFELTPSKQQIITNLYKCNYRTPPIKISKLLEELFKEWPSKEGHWLFIAQSYPPRPINRILNYLIKRHINGQDTIQNPAGYFTNLIKYRKKRKRI